MKLIDNWSDELHRLWSIRFSIGFAVFTAAASVISAFDAVFNPWFLLALAILFNGALIPLSRLIKQDPANG